MQKGLSGNGLSKQYIDIDCHNLSDILQEASISNVSFFCAFLRAAVEADVPEPEIGIKKLIWKLLREEKRKFALLKKAGSSQKIRFFG